jgi:4-diphosphocytidyl-2-C-methyl-D-erythritol kinase
LTDSLRLPAPAKLNLMLRIVGRRPDGYHLLQTVFQFVEQCDWITLRHRRDGRVVHANPLPDVPVESDLTMRAAELLRRETGRSDLGADIDIVKNLPMGGGLGGGSSDAATTLLGLNKLWALNLSIDVLADFGLRLGADVPVFVRGQAAWAEGIGEHLVPLPQLPEPWYLIVVPQCHVSTAEVFNAPELTRNHKPIRIADFLNGQQDNHCLSVVSRKYPPVQEAMIALLDRAGNARLTGTGACIFAAFDRQADAETAANAMATRWKVFVARGANTSPLHRALGLA